MSMDLVKVGTLPRRRGDGEVPILVRPQPHQVLTVIVQCLRIMNKKNEQKGGTSGYIYTSLRKTFLGKRLAIHVAGVSDQTAPPTTGTLAPSASRIRFGQSIPSTYFEIQGTG